MIYQLSGRKLEEINDSKSQLDDLFKKLQSICNCYVDLDPNLRFIVTSVIDMRASGWGENTAPTVTTVEIRSEPEYFVSFF